MCIIAPITLYSCECTAPSANSPRLLCEKGKKEQAGGSPCSIRLDNDGVIQILKIPEKCPEHEAAWWKAQEQLWRSELLSIRHILDREENALTKAETVKFWGRIKDGHRKWLDQREVAKKNMFDYKFCESNIRECLDDILGLRGVKDLPKAT